MARNEVFKEADYLSLPVAEGVVSGQAVRVGGLNGVAQTDRGAEVDPAAPYVQDISGNVEGYASVALKGAFLLPVSTTAALTIGAPVYITGAGVLTPADNSGANALFGHALTPKSTTANSLVVVRIAN